MGYILHWKTKIYILTKWHNLVGTKFVIVLSQYETSSDEQNWTNFLDYKCASVAVDLIMIIIARNLAKFRKYRSCFIKSLISS